MEHVTRVRVRYAETDRMGVAHHASYLLWFEIGRTDMLRDIGRCYREMEGSGAMLPVIEYACRFKQSAEYDDEVEVRTRVECLRSREVTFSYTCSRGDDVLATGMTRHVCVSDRNRPRRIPEDVHAALSAVCKSAARDRSVPEPSESRTT